MTKETEILIGVDTGINTGVAVWDAKMIKINIIPMSVNAAWQGIRFKTKAYKKYERDLLFLLPKITIPKAPYNVSFILGFSSRLSDIDNPIKQILDIMQKKYQFNDKDIYRLTIEKKIVSKGDDFFSFNISTL